MKYLVFTIAFIFSAGNVIANENNIVLVDKQATPETQALFYNLKRIADEDKVLFGHHDALLYGHSWVGEKDRSDVKDITGSHPALLGLDFAELTTNDTEKYKRAKQKLTDAVKATYKRGGVVAFCWHMSNPATGGSFYWEKDPVKVVADILPGGKHHEKYKSYLKTVAQVNNDFRGDNNELIPIIFRPFHEFDGDWFWWGKGHCSREEFISLWRFTVEYLRDTLHVRNFLYAFSPDCRFTTESEFLDYYPGDNYVDILGFDDYWDFRPDGNNDPELAEMKLKIVSDITEKKDKIVALTETGLESVSQTEWFTKVLMPILERVKVSYVMLWRNAHDMAHHFYVPYKGHPAENDFIKFYNNKNILFEDDMEKIDMYSLKN